MAKIDRGVYEPPPGEGRAFDDDDQEDEGSRLPLILVIGLIVLAAFFGVVWLAYSQGVQRGREDAPRIITADRGPIREAPTGAMAEGTANKGLKIYEQPAPDDEAGDEDTDAAPSPPSDTEAQVIAPAAAPPAMGGSSASTAVPEAASPATTASAAPKPLTGGLSAAPPPGKAASKVAPASKPAQKPAEKPSQQAAMPAPAATVAPPTSMPAAGGYLLQLGAAKSEQDANSTWRAFRSKHPIVGGYEPNIVRVDLGDKGVWFRLRIGPFADKATATAFCAKLKADGGDCIPVK